MSLSGINDVAMFSKAREILIIMGEYFQIQDDYLGGWIWTSLKRSSPRSESRERSALLTRQHLSLPPSLSLLFTTIPQQIAMEPLRWSARSALISRTTSALGSWFRLSGKEDEPLPHLNMLRTNCPASFHHLKYCNPAVALIRSKENCLRRTTGNTTKRKCRRWKSSSLDCSSKQHSKHMRKSLTQRSR